MAWAAFVTISLYAMSALLGCKFSRVLLGDRMLHGGMVPGGGVCRRLTLVQERQYRQYMYSRSQDARILAFGAPNFHPSNV